MGDRSQSREAIAALRKAGFAVAEAETPGGANWTRWSAETDSILELFFPAE